jgi:alkanesulfonate monooxygenase SsuD/methylene tetrahydromethanopterin reductase-like flavin-dependent oxidoreductase (luciferase family)
MSSWCGTRGPVVFTALLESGGAQQATYNHQMEVAFSIDPSQRLSRGDELDCVRYAAELGYQSAWTPARGDAAAFDRCLAWHQASGLPTGIAVVPASGRRPEFYAQEAARVWHGTGGKFVLGVGSGDMAHAVGEMGPYLEALRHLLPPELPLYVAALGPRMLQLAGEMADGVSLNWCSADQVAWSRTEVERAASRAGRPTPPIAEYIRTAVDSDAASASKILGNAMRQYALEPGPYRRHFERMGFADDLAHLDSARARPSGRLPSAVGAWGAPGAVRQQFFDLSRGLDCAIVRVLVREPGDSASARRVLEECSPPFVQELRATSRRR